MDTQDPPTERAEGMYIGDALQRLAAELGIESTRQFALRFGLHYKHLVNLWGNKRRAGLVTVTEIARKTGRAVAYFFGEMQALPVLGSMDTMGRITMTTTESNAGLIHLPEACGVFVAGSRLVLEPSEHRDDTWLVVKSRDTNATWIAWSRRHHDLSLLVRSNGEAVVYSPAAHQILGAIVDVLVPPPKGPSA